MRCFEIVRIGHGVHSCRVNMFDDRSCFYREKKFRSDAKAATIALNDSAGFGVVDEKGNI